MNETKRSAIRAEVAGAYGWQSAPKINRRLVGNTLVQALQTNKRREKSSVYKRHIVTKKHRKPAKSTPHTSDERQRRQGTQLIYKELKISSDECTSSNTANNPSKSSKSHNTQVKNRFNKGAF